MARPGLEVFTYLIGVAVELVHKQEASSTCITRDGMQMSGALQRLLW